MNVFHRIYNSIRGGWKTHGPNALSGSAAFDGGGGVYATPSAEAAIRLAAVWACVTLRAETIGTLPLQLRDAQKNILTDHDAYYLLHYSPNAFYTPAEFWSQATAHTDFMGNAINVIERHGSGRPKALVPRDPTQARFEFNKSGTRKKWFIEDDTYDDDDVLDLRGFALAGQVGESRLAVGRQIIAAQLEANSSAMLAFKQGLKVGGFFKDERKSDMGTESLNAFYDKLNTFNRPENQGRWMKLPRGLTPLGVADMKISPADAQLLESRYFGIEEICRLFNVPPQLIGQSNKASSWASSIENINMHFVTYSLTPTLVRNEQRIAKKLLTPREIAKGIQPKFSLQGLLRGDTKTRQAFYQSALQNGWMNRNEVRDLEERGNIPGGDKYTVQLNMTDVNDLQNSDGTENNRKPDDEGDSNEA